MTLKALFFALFFIPLSVYAQTDMMISLSPTVPEPNQDVTLTLSSYSFDINVAQVTWKSGATTLLSGLGAKRLKVKMGQAGQSSTITYTALQANGESVEGSITLSPQLVDLVYEAHESYTPPFYEGLALPAEGSTVYVTAVPLITEGGARVPAQALSYNWFINGKHVDESSGVGRVNLTADLDYLTDTTEIRVLVRSPRGNTAEKTISIYPKKVLPVLYRYDETLGTDFTRAFDRRLELSSAVTLALEPYFLSAKQGLESSATYAWYLDGLPVTPDEKTLLSLRPKEDAYGSRFLTATVNNTKRILQKTEIGLEILFDTRAGN